MVPRPLPFGKLLTGPIDQPETVDCSLKQEVFDDHGASRPQAERRLQRRRKDATAASEGDFSKHRRSDAPCPARSSSSRCSADAHADANGAGQESPTTRSAARPAPHPAAAGDSPDFIDRPACSNVVTPRVAPAAVAAPTAPVASSDTPRVFKPTGDQGH
jgi:hypothetical protein